MDREMGLDGKRPSREQTLFSIMWTVHCPLLEASSQVLPKTNDSLPPAVPPRPAPPCPTGGSSRLQLHRGPPAARAMPTHWLPSCQARPVAPRPPTHVCMCACVCSPVGARPGAALFMCGCVRPCVYPCTPMTGHVVPTRQGKVSFLPAAASSSLRGDHSPSPGRGSVSTE